MRVIGRLLFLLLLIALLVFSWEAARFLFNTLTQQSLEPWEDSYDKSTVYLLHPGETFTFEVPNEAAQLRILHTPVGISAFDEQAQLALENEKNKQLSHQYQIVLRGEASLPVTPDQLPERFLESPQDRVAGSTQLHVVSFQHEQDFEKFTLTLTESSRPIAIRVAFLELESDKTVARVWQRLSNAQKETVFKDHIYPVDLVPVKERKAFLMQRWQPIGPASSSEGKVITQTLFVHKDADIQSGEHEIINELTVVGPQRWYTIDTREELLSVAFSCARLAGEGEINLELSSLDANGKLLVEPIRVVSATQRVAFPSTQTLYRISANQPCELTFYDDAGGVMPAVYSYLRAALVAVNIPVNFALVAESETVQPLRLDARLVTDETAALPATVMANWSITDEKGKLLLGGQLPLKTSVNPYQVTVELSLTKKVHEKISHYIVAPQQAARLQVSVAPESIAAGVELLVNLYTRPDDLPYPVSLAVVDETQSQLTPKWFLSRPSSLADKTPAPTELLSWQTPLPVITAAEEHNEQWYSLESLNNEAYTELFIPQAPLELSSDMAKQSKGLTFLPIQVQDSNYSLTAAGHVKQVRPQLVYQKAGAQPASIAIKINGQLIRRDWVSSATGKLVLPSLSPGDYKLSISASPAIKWFSNYQKLEGTQHYLLRNAYTLDQKLTFKLPKTEAEEWVSFHYFPAIKQQHQITIRVEKRTQSGEYADYTVRERIFTLPAATDDPKVSLLHQQRAPIWEPKRLPFLLGADLEKGSYRISVTSSAPGSGYIQAGYLAQPPAYQIEVYTEDGNALF